MIDPNAVPSDLHYTEMLIEIIGAKMNEELRRVDLFSARGHEYMESRADSAAATLRELLIVIASGRYFYGAIPSRLADWDANGRPWSWPLLPAGATLAVCWCGDENACCQPAAVDVP